jgi:hypothetical protein
MGQENFLGSFLVGGFIFDYFMGSFFACLVVGIFTFDASNAIENTLSLVDWLGL